MLEILDERTWTAWRNLTSRENVVGPSGRRADANNRRVDEGRADRDGQSSGAMPARLAASCVTAATNAPPRSSATVLWPGARKFGDNQRRMCGMSVVLSDSQGIPNGFPRVGAPSSVAIGPHRAQLLCNSPSTLEVGEILGRGFARFRGRSGRIAQVSCGIDHDARYQDSHDQYPRQVPSPLGKAAAIPAIQATSPAAD